MAINRNLMDMCLKVIVKSLIIMYMLMLSFIGLAQKEANIWYFGCQAGLDFNSGMPVPLTDGELCTDEGVATISDGDGDLLFYTDGITVWNRSHTIMLNGSGLTGHSSSTQSGVIVPIPGSPNRYYLFTVGDVGKELAYSEIDMTLDGGLGGIIVGRKNMRLIERAAEKITAVRHANGRDVWVITHRAPDPSPTDEFVAYLVTDRGLSPVPVTTNTGSPYSIGANLRGYMKVSTDGSKIAVAIENLLRFESYVDLFDFNNSTGRLSNYNTLVFSGFSYECYGVEFSPNNKLLYVASRFNPNIYQFDLTVPDIAASRVEITTIGDMGALQIGPDQRIYIAQSRPNLIGIRSNHLGIIENPNIRGLGCDFRSDAIFLGRGFSAAGLPTFIQSFFRVTHIIENICQGDSYFFKEENRSISGAYKDTLVSSSGVRDSVVVLTLTVNPLYNEVLDEAICTGESFMVGINSYTTPGTYVNRLTTVEGCDSIVTLNLTVNPTYNEVLNEAICTDENFLFEGNIYTTSGTYTNRLTTVEGCDSIVTLNLTVNPTYNEVLNEAEVV